MPAAEAVWRESASLLPLHWGNYRDRYLVGLILISAGGLAVQGSNTWILGLLLQGTIAHAIGWAILPARGWRRLLVVLPSTGAIWLLLTGPQSMWALAFPYLCWLVARHRPLRSYLTLVFPVANGLMIPQFFEEYSGMPLALAISLTVLIGSAWIARLLAASAPIPRSGIG